MTTKIRVFLLLFVSSFLALVVLPVRPAAALPAGFSRHLVENGLDTPTSMAWKSGGGILYVTEKDGTLRVIKDGSLRSTPVYTFSVNTASERGLLGVAIDPDFLTNRYLYLYYTRSSAPVKNRVVRITLNANLLTGVPASEQVLLDDIPSDAGNHNAGALHFANSGKLLVATGDGGSTPANSQDLTNLAGKILRINKDGTIPSDNPFFGMGGGTREEIWSYGLRNPYTFAVKRATGSVFINDVGQSTWEEINKGMAGRNFGWPTCEGSCSISGLVNPFYKYGRSIGRAITGGTFYEKTMFPAKYRNDYFYADYLGGWIRSVDLATKDVTKFHTTAAGPVDLDVGASGTLYYLSITNGAVYKVVYN